jgi:hypothetical protein
MLKLSLFRAIMVKTFWLSQGSVSPSRRILCTRLSHVHRHARTSVGLRRIVGTCQDPWSLASFPLPSSLDPIIRPSRTYADSRLGNSHFCFCALPRSNVVRYAARWRSCNIVYIKLFVHNMIHFLLSSGLVP